MASLTSSTSVVHVVDAVNSFKESEWIGVGQKYQSVPPEVSDERNRVLWIPGSHFKQNFPAFDINVMQFIASEFPEISNSIPKMKISIWFSKDMPTTDPECLRMRHVPPEGVLTQLLSAFGQEWLDGAKSIVDPRFNDGGDRLPLWTIRFWKKMTDVISDRDKWAKGYRWLEKQRGAKHDKETKVAVEEALQVLGTIPWRRKLKYCRGTVDTRCLTTLLGNGWLSDDHINIMMEEHSNAVEEDASLKDQVIVAPLEFSQEIRNNGKTGIYERKKGAGLLWRYEKHIEEKGIERLLFPVHINDNHWVAAFVDFKNGKIGYGDSLSHLESKDPHRTFMPQLRLWLGVRFGMNPEDEGDVMRHGKQNDTFNCGLTTANTIGHYLFKIPLWTPDRAVLERVQWFLHIFRAMSPAENPISIPSDTHMMDIHLQAEKLPAEDLDMDIEISPSGNQIADEDESLSQIPAEVPGVSAPQFQRSYQAQANHNPTANEEILASKIAVDIPQPSKSQPQPHLQVPHTDNTQRVKEDDNSRDTHVDTPALLTNKSSRFRFLYEHLEACEDRQTDRQTLSRQLLNDVTSTKDGLPDHLFQTLSRQLLDDVTFKDDLPDHLFDFSDILEELYLRIKLLVDGDDLLAKLTREWTEARSEVQEAVNQHLDAESELSDLRRKMEELKKERDEASHEAQQLEEILQEMRAVRSEVQQLDHQGLEADFEMSQLRRKVTVLTEERDQALEEGHQLRDLIQGLKSFGWGAPSDPWLVEDHGRPEELSDRHRHSSLGAQPNTQDETNTQDENPHYMAWLRKALASRIQLFFNEKNRREDLESEFVVLKSKLGKARLYSHLLSEYGAFARHVQMTAYALEGVQASISRETDFPCKDFRTIIRSLSIASTKAKKDVSTRDDGKFNIVGFIESDESDFERKERDHGESR